MDMLRIGLSSLITTQYGLSVTSNNIANASTPGYARQTLSVSQPTSIAFGGNYYGQGVYVDSVDRVGSDHLETSLRNTRAGQQYYGTLYNLGLETDKMLSDQDTGLDKSFQTLFTALGDLGNSPTSEATRSVLIDSMEALGGKFASMANVLRLNGETVDKDLVSTTDRITALANDLVNLNEGIQDSLSKTGTKSAQLVDARYQVLSEMSDYIDIDVHESDDGIVSVYVGEGMALVANNEVSPITAEPNGYSDGQYEVFIRGVEISDQISGGSLGGVLDYRDNILQTSENELGLLALGFTQLANARHKEGYTPSGVAGGDLYANFSAVAQDYVNNTGTGVLTVSFDTSGSSTVQEGLLGQLKPLVYEVVDTGSGYDVFDANSGDLLLSGAPASFTLDGLDFDMSGATSSGDRFLINPMAKAIDNYEVLISDTADFANSQDPAGSISDNRNTLHIFDIQSLKYLNNGLDTVQGGYSTLIANVGSKVSTAEASSATFTALYSQASLNRDSESGVNVEEEAAEIMRLQQQYSASAKIVTAAQDIFNELMAAIG